MTSPRQHPGTVASSVDDNVGFHFTHDTTLTWRRPPGCHALHVDYILPPDVFADPYELDLRADDYTYTIDAYPDLERPVSAVEQRNTRLRLDVKLPSDVEHAEGVTEVALPLHGRYGLPSSRPRGEAYAVAYVPPPQAFWECGKGQDIFTIPLASAPSAKDVPLVIPIGLSDDLAFVQTGTALTVLAVFCYMAFVFSKVHNRLGIRLYQSKRE
ncbi:PIG-X [Phanerochaete sordida]|uniref:Protein PBN1 n=1 Tax=Phanerochaete sordida TaxID=48140 RepID=A0A9P3GJG8_9APHY|nr:PIG-X [Phanerochaete sordida]